MSAMESIIDNFIGTNNFDESIKDSLIEVVNKCFTCYVEHMSSEWLNNVPVTKTKAVGSPKTKTTKADKLEDPTEATSLEDLRRCTSVTLNTFCKENGLKTGGNKKELSDRVWAYIEGQQSDKEIQSISTTKPKKASGRSKSKSGSSSKQQSEKHQCFGCNDKGLPCGTSATEEHQSDSGESHWFCWRHITDAEKIITSKNLSELILTSHATGNDTDTDNEGVHDIVPEPVVSKKKVTKPKKPSPALLEESD